MRNPHKDLKCNRCGRKGHIKADCRSKETSKKNEDQGGFQKTMIFTAGKTKELESCWLLDSGATHHLAWNRELFTELEEFDEEVYVEGVSEELLKIEGIGCIDLVCETDGGTHQIRLEGVKFAPKAGVNLASLSKFLNKGAILHGERRVLTLSKEGETFLQANNQIDLMVIQTANKPGPRAFMASEAEKAELWHRRFGHAGLDSLAKIAQEGLVEGMPVRTGSFKKIRDEVREPCVLRKQTRKSFPASKRESQGPMDLIHTDVCRPMQTKTPGGRRYFVSFTDDYSRSAVIQLLSDKNQVQDALEAFVNTMETHFDRKVKAIQSDRGGEFWNKEMTDTARAKGSSTGTNPYSSQENGVAERLNRTLMEKGRAMLQDAGLGTEYWGEAVLTASYVRNRTVSSVHGKTPLEMLTGKKPTVDHLRVFGVTAYAHVPSQRRQKLDAVAEKGVFLGYEPNTKGYRILQDKDKRVVVSKDKEKGQMEKKKLKQRRGFIQSAIDKPARVTRRLNGSARITQRRLQRGEQNRRLTKRPCLDQIRSFGRRQWMKKLPRSWKNQTWTVEEVPPRVKPVPVKWVYKIKSDEHGNIERFKARVCAKGYKQTQGVDFEEVFAPVSRQPTLRTLLAVAAVQDLEVKQLDVKTAFLNGDLEEDIWMDQPKGFEVGGKTKACHLQKALYGLKQAPRAWHLKLTKEVSGLGFEPSSADPSLFIRKSKGSITYVAVWVRRLSCCGIRKRCDGGQEEHWGDLHGPSPWPCEVLSRDGDQS
jgi:hypothetical protein